jgi:hypothetical protein
MFVLLAPGLVRVGLIVSGRVRFVGTVLRLRELSLSLASFLVICLVLSSLFGVCHTHSYANGRHNAEDGLPPALNRRSFFRGLSYCSNSVWLGAAMGFIVFPMELPVWRSM